MKMSEAFPSQYLRAADLGDQPRLFVMDHVTMEKIGQEDHKPVLFFQGAEKGLVLNKTNGKTISDIYGDDSDDWVGKEIVLYPAMVQYKSEMVEAIRVRAPKKRTAAVPPKPAPAPPPVDDDRGARMDDEIPF